MTAAPRMALAAFLLGGNLPLLASLVAACGACQANPAPGPLVTDAALTDEAAAVCGHLRAIGCFEASTCEETYRKVLSYRTRAGSTMTDLHGSCLLSASSPAAAQACGSSLCTVTATSATPPAP